MRRGIGSTQDEGGQATDKGLDRNNGNNRLRPFFDCLHMDEACLLGTVRTFQVPFALIASIATLEIEAEQRGIHRRTRVPG